jgi:hypothetical protein
MLEANDGRSIRIHGQDYVLGIYRTVDQTSEVECMQRFRRLPNDRDGREKNGIADIVEDLSKRPAVNVFRCNEDSPVIDAFRLVDSGDARMKQSFRYLRFTKYLL